VLVGLFVGLFVGPLGSPLPRLFPRSFPRPFHRHRPFLAVLAAMTNPNAPDASDRTDSTDRALADLIARTGRAAAPNGPNAGDTGRNENAPLLPAWLRYTAILCVLGLATAMTGLVAVHTQYSQPPAVETAAPALALPVDGVASLPIVSPWGASRDGGRRSHKGIDIFAPVGTPVVAPRPGTIAGRYTGATAGKYVWLVDAEGEYGYLFLHLSRFAEGVGRGTAVETGDVIGYVGKTGNATHTPGHLHFGVARLHTPGTLADGKTKVNPRPFLHASDTPGIPRTLDGVRTQIALLTHAHWGVEVWLPLP
jgi:murein DD-endopeptidase MepM/ murein hydrolase activator NlpD